LQYFYFCRTSEKRVSAVAFSNDGLYVTFADKFGVIWLVSVAEDGEGQVPADSKPVSVFGHYCSIIISMVWTFFTLDHSDLLVPPISYSNNYLSVGTFNCTK
jgi:hypothetical protein